MLVTLETEMQKTLFAPDCSLNNMQTCAVIQLSLSALLQSSLSIILLVKHKNINSAPGLIFLIKKMTLYIMSKWHFKSGICWSQQQCGTWSLVIEVRGPKSLLDYDT